MKRVKNFLKRIIQIAGGCLGFLFSFLDKNKKRKVVVFFCNISFKLGGRYYFWFYEFLKQMMCVMFRDDYEENWVKKRLKTGGVIDVDLSRVNQRNIYSHKLYEINISNFFLNNIKKGDTFFDIGSNVGYFSILLSPLVGKEGKIFAFEPEKNNFNFLVKNVNENIFLNIFAINKGVGNKNEKLTLYLHPLNNGGHSFIEFKFYKFGDLKFDKDKFNDKKLLQKIDVLKIDDFAVENNIDRVDFMKIDIEGYELDALKGMENLLKRKKILNIVCEVNNNETRLDVFKFMNSLGYTIYRLDVNGVKSKLDIHQKMSKGDVLFSLEK
ncbi:hypothetical protein A2442_00570 [Candidatus Campbellbacteria bacterium RIFOXYC2_FULL_35_25]|uniref:Methyltransferase FkbM domain-containing protein n=1 Tax=Candidatus Campbellbacteria bacterium RIFOXYC2_FULL_35_25 TaxID=1797582 RepID=A0A1F5EIM2_9BACT|nr:MAG: hypothetical protein A2442_00570 [Candidatus Campbellbacteria bacterium RIFOXYC2_FULL_35_25]